MSQALHTRHEPPSGGGWRFHDMVHVLFGAAATAFATAIAWVLFRND